MYNVHCLCPPRRIKCNGRNRINFENRHASENEKFVSFMLLPFFLISLDSKSRKSRKYDKYEGDSICNDIVRINKKVSYLYALQLHS